MADGSIDQALEDMNKERVIEHVDSPTSDEAVVYVPPELSHLEGPAEIHVLPSSFKLPISDDDAND